MSERTLSSMHDARDAEDKRLLEAGEYERLLENYVYLVREWTLVRLRDREAADEVSQRVFLRLLRELRTRKRYVVPFRVVVWKVVDFMCRGYEWGTRRDGGLPEEWDSEAPDAFAAWEDEYDVAKMLADLPERQRQVLELVYLERLGPEQVAARLGMKRNAVDQALHNGHRKLAERLVAELARELFVEFADAYARGERPDAQAFLERAGAEGDDLARLIERFLQGVPAPFAGPQDAALLAAWLGTEPPLLELRRRQGLRVDEVVDRLGTALGIDAKRQPRLKWQYQRLEGGTLDPAGVAARVWQALAEIFAAPARDLAGAWRLQPAPREAFLRAPLAATAAIPPTPGLDPDEEIDSLFAAGDADS